MPATLPDSKIKPAAARSFFSALVCPDCRKALAENGGALRCPACNASFPIQDGVPKLWPASRAAELEASIGSFRGAHNAVRESSFFRALLPPSPIYDPGASNRIARVKAALASGLVVNLGAKNARWGEHVINLDLVSPASGDKPDLLGDIQRLPFADASVDGIICTYVLEHVADARACIDEISRVVKPGGQIYISVPFIFPTHPDPLDRWRWTLDGLRHSFSGFDEIEAGPNGGPFSAMVSTVPTLLGSVFSNFFLFNAVRCALGWLMWPLKFLDVVAARSTRAHMTAPNFFFWGRKR